MLMIQRTGGRQPDPSSEHIELVVALELLGDARPASAVVGDAMGHDDDRFAPGWHGARIVQVHV
jgi:hypothetical protein